jgi:hypothetical protein
MFDELVHMHTDLLQAGKTEDVQCEDCRSGQAGIRISRVRCENIQDINLVIIIGFLAFLIQLLFRPIVLLKFLILASTRHS